MQSKLPISTIMTANGMTSDLPCFINVLGAVDIIWNFASLKWSLIKWLLRLMQLITKCPSIRRKTEHHLILFPKKVEGAEETPRYIVGNLGYAQDGTSLCSMCASPLFLIKRIRKNEIW